MDEFSAPAAEVCRKSLNIVVAHLHEPVHGFWVFSHRQPPICGASKPHLWICSAAGMTQLKADSRFEVEGETQEKKGEKKPISQIATPQTHTNTRAHMRLQVAYGWNPKRASPGRRA